MRRFLALLALLALPASLLAQEGPGRRGRWQEQLPDTPVVNAKAAWVGGVTTFARGDYQPSGVDVQYAVRTDHLPVAALGIGVRVGSFVQNQAVLIGLRLAEIYRTLQRDDAKADALLARIRDAYPNAPELSHAGPG